MLLAARGYVSDEINYGNGEGSGGGQETIIGDPTSLAGSKFAMHVCVISARVRVRACPQLNKCRESQELQFLQFLVNLCALANLVKLISIFYIDGSRCVIVCLLVRAHVHACVRAYARAYMRASVLERVHVRLLENVKGVVRLLPLTESRNILIINKFIIENCIEHLAI